MTNKYLIEENELLKAKLKAIDRYVNTTLVTFAKGCEARRLEAIHLTTKFAYKEKKQVIEATIVQLNNILLKSTEKKQTINNMVMKDEDNKEKPTLKFAREVTTKS